MRYLARPAGHGRVRWAVLMTEPLKACVEAWVGFTAGLSTGKQARNGFFKLGHCHDDTSEL